MQTENRFMTATWKLALTIVVVTASLLAWPPWTVYTQKVSAPVFVQGIDKPVRVIRGRFTQDLTLTNDTYWVLRGAVFMEAPARLFIEPGTRIIGETATRGTLIIERGSQIIADGTREQPIVMTSDQPIGRRGRGDWGGLIINGNAPVNLPGGVGIGEGSTGIYGGNDPNDSSGILRYVRVEYAGIEFSPDNELNGIAFQGVGRGTIVEYVQVHFNKDDGVEFFGGTVDAKWLVLTGIGDDAIDWTFGWTGRIQFAIVQQRGDDADNGIEADNNGNNNDLLPRSAPTLYNITLVGDPGLETGPESTDGARLREGTAGIIRNAIVMGFKSEAFDVRNASTLAQIGLGTLQVSHSIAFDNRGGGGSAASQARNADGAALWDPSGNQNATADPMLVAPYDLTAPDWRPMPGSPALTLLADMPPGGAFFDIALFRGALGPDVESDWTRGWTTFAQR
jgi:hypothetical protein